MFVSKHPVQKIQISLCCSIEKDDLVTHRSTKSILFLCSASAYRDEILKKMKEKKEKNLGGKICGNLPFWKLDASNPKYLGHKSLFRAVEPSCTYRKLQYPLVFLFS